MSGATQILRDSSTALTEPNADWEEGGAAILIAVSLGGSLVFANATLVNVALARIGRDLALAPSEMQWVVNAELLPLAALTLVAGVIGDRFGEKRTFLWGVFVFMAGAVISAIAPNWWALVGARFLQGLGDALILPNALSILGRAFPRETKTLAVGIWSAIGAATSAAAPAVAGWILSQGSWRQTLMIPIPIAVTAFLVGAVWVPRSAVNAEISIDHQGAALSIIGLGCFGWTLTALTSDAKGENPLIPVAVLVIALLALAALVVMEGRRGDKAMLPPSLFASRSVIGANLFTFLLYGCLNVIFTLLPFVMIRGVGLSSLVAGLAFVPLQILIIIISPLAGHLCRQFGRRAPLIVGGLVVAASFVAAMRLGPQMQYWRDVFPAMALLALGMGLVSAPLTTLVLTSVEVDRAGTASGVNSAVSRAGSLLAVALLGPVLQLAGASLIAGFHVAMGISALICVLAALAVFIVEPGPHLDYVPPT